jgi:hypothetical protein
MTKLNPNEKYTEEELTDHIFKTLNTKRVYSSMGDFKLWSLNAFDDKIVFPKPYASGLHTLELTSDTQITALRDIGKIDKIFNGEIKGLEDIVRTLEHFVHKPNAGQLTVDPNIIQGIDGKTHFVYALNLYTI